MEQRLLNEMRIVQLKDVTGALCVARVVEDQLQVIHGFPSTYELALAAIEQERSINELVETHTENTFISYAEVIAAGQLKPPVTHPDPAHMWITGTGLTHLGSAAARDSMHSKLSKARRILQTA